MIITIIKSVISKVIYEATPNLYLIALWLCMSAGFSIVLENVHRGMAVASALSLFYVLNGYYKMEMYNRQMFEQFRKKIEGNTYDKPE